jgi:hypothetical protein
MVANALKYPFMKFGSRSASATGNSLIDGYRKIGRLALTRYLYITVTIMFAIQAVVTLSFFLRSAFFISPMNLS